MDLPHLSTPRIAQPFIKRASLIAIIIGLCLTSWVGWTAWTLWEDQLLPPERVTAQQLRVAESQRQQLLQNLDTYHNPTATGTVPNVPFQGGS